MLEYARLIEYTGLRFITNENSRFCVLYGQNRHKIEYSNIKTFLDVDIVSGSCSLQHALSGESLATDTLTFRAIANVGNGFVLADDQELLTDDGQIFLDGDYTIYADYAPVEYYFEGDLISKTYIRKVERTGRYLYEFDCVSAIGLLDNSIHPGGVYSGTLLSTILAEILAGITYTVDPAIANIKIYGWLPYDSKRNNLQQITIATSIAVRNNPDGSLRITALDSNTKGSFLIDRLAIGAGVDVAAPKKAVQVMEHYYLESNDAVELFNGTFLTEEIILFPEPAHSITITGGTIISSSANHAVVQGAGAVVIAGKKYLHNTKQVTAGTLIGASSDNIVVVNDATLINPLNSKAVAQKLFDAFKTSRKITGDVLFGNERPGDIVNVTNPHTFMEESAITKKMDIVFGGFLKASSEFLVGYKPSGAITGFQNHLMITASGSITVPDDVTQMRIILASGGQGGQGGFDGQQGGTATYDPWAGGSDDVYVGGVGGVGGAYGQSGNPGKIIDVLIDVTPGSVINYAIGVGGDGGLNGSPGNYGGPTTFGIYSSDSGSVPIDGYVDIMDGTAYGFYGVSGIAGEAGGNGGTSNSPGTSGGNLDTASGGTGGNGVTADDERAGGGGGGGAAHNTDGDNGGNAYEQGIDLYTGTGGNGASPTKPSDAALSNGGDGGHGGGGGGGQGGLRYNSSTEWHDRHFGSVGLGGIGSQGASGGDGFIIIYY